MVRARRATPGPEQFQGKWVPDRRIWECERVTDAEAKNRRFQEAIAARVDPTAVVDSINDAESQRATAQADLNRAPTSTAMDRAQIDTMIGSLGDVSRALDGSKPEQLQELYAALRLQMIYNPEDQFVDLRINPGVVSVSEEGRVH